MGAYKFLGEVDKNKVFVVQRSILVDRFDSQFYNTGFDFSEFIKLSTVVSVKGGKRIPKGKSYATEETKYIYLRVTDLDSDLDDSNSLKYIDEEIYTILERYKIEKDDLAISIAGTIGKTRLMKDIPENKKVILTENCAKILIKDKETLSPEFLDILLNLPILQKQIELNYIQTTIPKLGLDRIKDLRIPKIPLLEIQINIVKIYSQAYQTKQYKEQEAKDLIKSIDTYLLKELGIDLIKKDNSLKSRMFIVKFSEVSGDRFDSSVIHNKNNKIEGGKYKNYELHNIANVVKGQSITSEKIIEGDYPVIAGGQSSPYFHNIFNHNGNVITVSASGAYSGYVWYHANPIFASDCSVIQSKNENNVITMYLAEILKLKQQEIYYLQRGAGQPHVYSNDLKKLNIPVPIEENGAFNLDKQYEFLNHINNIRTKAKKLNEEANLILKEAKQEVEHLIVGEQ